MAAEAARVIAAEGPHLSWVYLQYTDDVAHASGDGSDFDAAVGVMDGLVGQIWAAVAGPQAQYGEDWLILVTTDHGRDAETGQDHGGQSLRERTTWMVTNSQRLNPAYYSQPEMVDIYPSIVAHLGLPIPQQVAAGLDHAGRCVRLLRDAPEGPAGPRRVPHPRTTLHRLSADGVLRPPLAVAQAP